MLRYPVLVVDHDDTVVDSTATVHYPCFVQYMREFHPGFMEGPQAVSLRTYFEKNFDPGVIGFFRDIIGMDEEELAFEQEYWGNYVKSAHHIPRVFPGMDQILWEQKRRGGYVCVASHSFSQYIYRDYEVNQLPKPDLVFGWDLAPELRKPATFTLEEIMRKLDCGPEDLLMVDDLKPGYDMSRGCGVAFAAALWAYDIPMIENFMRAHSDFAFKTTKELYDFLFEE